MLNHYTRTGRQNVAKRAACTARARAHFSKILLRNLHSLYARETTKARLRVMITRAQHSFGTLPPGVMFQTLPLSSRALEGLGTRLLTKGAWRMQRDDTLEPTLPIGAFQKEAILFYASSLLSPCE